MNLPSHTNGPAEVDAITQRALHAVLSLHPHERLLLACGMSLRELGVRTGTSHAQLSAVFTKATAFRRMSQLWIDRLTQATGMRAEEIRALFGIPEHGPSLRHLSGAA